MSVLVLHRRRAWSPVRHLRLAEAAPPGGILSGSGIEPELELLQRSQDL